MKGKKIMAKIETICPLCESKSKSESRLDSCPVCGVNLVSSKEKILEKADSMITKDIVHEGVLLLSNQRIFWLEQPTWHEQSLWFKPWFMRWFLRPFHRRSFLSSFFDAFFPYPKVMKFSFRLDEITEVQVKRDRLNISTLMIDGSTIVVEITRGMHMHFGQWDEWVDAINDAKERFLAENYATTRIVKSFSDIPEDDISEDD